MIWIVFLVHDVCQTALQVLNLQWTLCLKPVVQLILLEKDYPSLLTLIAVIPSSQCSRILSQTNSSSVTFNDSIVLFMDMIYCYHRQLPFRLMNDKVPFTKLFAYFWILLVKRHLVLQVHWKPSGIVCVIICKEVWDQVWQGFSILFKVSFMELIRRNIANSISSTIFQNWTCGLSLLRLARKSSKVRGKLPDISVS